MRFCGSGSVLGVVLALSLGAAGCGTGGGSSRVNGASQHSGLHAAIRAGSVPEVGKLLAAGVSPNARDANEVPALHTAVHNNRHAIAKLLLFKGALPDIRDHKLGMTPMHVAAEAVQDGDLSEPDGIRFLELLINNHADINARSTYLRATPAWWARRNFTLSKFFKKMGAVSQSEDAQALREAIAAISPESRDALRAASAEHEAQAAAKRKQLKAP